MQKLLDGVHRFRTEEFGRYRDLFARLSREGQRPHTLFITCSDSRVLAELITQSRPGDLFVVKNVGNIVPPAGTAAHSSAAAVEYAVEILGVEDIVVCGHSHCGAIDALMGERPDPERLPHLAAWLSLARPVRETVDTRYAHLSSEEERRRAAEEENVLFSLDNLRGYPAVSRQLGEGTLRLHAWFFKIETAELFAYDPAVRQFAPLVGLSASD